MIFNDRRNAKALKAANGPSLAPKGYKPDKESRAKVYLSASGGTNLSDGLDMSGSRKQRFNSAAIKAEKNGFANSNDPWTSKNDSVRRK